MTGEEARLDLYPFDRWETWVVASGERAADWRRVFGVAGVPVESVFPRLFRREGEGEPVLCYMLAMDWLDEDPERRKRVVEATAEKFGLSPAEVETELQAGHGMPLPADGLAVVIHGIVVDRGGFGS